MEMTPNRKNNKHYSLPEDRMSMNGGSGGGGGIGMVKSNSGSCYAETHSSLSRRDSHSHQFSRTTPERILEQRNPHSNHSQSYNQQKPFRRQGKLNGNDKAEFIPLFVLAEASRESSERKVQEICQKLYVLPREEAEPVVNFQDQAGRTALSYGCGCGNISIIDAVSRFKFADPNLPDNEGNAPLHYSSVCGHSEGVDLLLTRFHAVIDVNARNASGITPLMKAALQGRTRCAKSLLAAGASPLIKDHIRGLSAAEWARLTGRHMCAEIINRSSYDFGEEETNKTNGKSNANGNGGSRSGSSLVYSRTLPNLQLDSEKSRNSLTSEETPYYHLYARSTVNGAKWLKNKIKKALGGARSGEDRSFVYDNPAVRSLADRRPTLPADKNNFSVLSNLGLGGAAICASSLLLPDIQPIVDHQRQRPKVVRKMPIPVVQITPVRR